MKRSGMNYSASSKGCTRQLDSQHEAQAQRLSILCNVWVHSPARSRESSADPCCSIGGPGREFIDDISGLFLAECQEATPFENDAEAAAHARPQQGTQRPHDRRLDRPRTSRPLKLIPAATRSDRSVSPRVRQGKRSHPARVVVFGDRCMSTRPQSKRMRGHPPMGWIAALTNAGLRGLVDTSCRVCCRQLDNQIIRAQSESIELQSCEFGIKISAKTQHI